MSSAKAYERLARQLLADIEQGRYAVGERLPTELELCEQSGLARGTVRQALRCIEELGMISRRTRTGTVVLASSPVDDYQPLFSHPGDSFELIRRTKIRTPVVRDVVADAASAARLGVSRGSRWVCIEGPRVLREQPAVPVCWSEQYLRPNAEHVSRVLRGDVSAEEARVFDVEQTISAALLDDEIADRLGASPGPALVIRRRRLDSRGHVRSVGVHTHPADRYQVTSILRGDPERTGAGT